MLFLVCVVVFVEVMYSWNKCDPQSNELFLKFLTPIGLITTVAFALYGDFLRGWFYPVEIRIEVLKEGETNQHIDKIYQADELVNLYCHHLRVRNLTPKKTISNCRVWLKRISIVDASKPNEEDDEIIFAVPRLMEWAPSEYSPDKRTFITDQIFDLGKTNKYGFELTIYREQKAAISTLSEQREKFKQGATIKCVIFVTADNYHEQKEYSFQITAGTIEHTLSKIVAVSNEPKKSDPLGADNDAGFSM